MKENETSEDVTKTPSEKNNPGKTGSSSENTLVKGEDEEKKEGDEFIREGHGHDYSVPVASEDGGTEDQSADQNTDMSKPTEQGKTQGESSTI